MHGLGPMSVGQLAQHDVAAVALDRGGDGRWFQIIVAGRRCLDDRPEVRSEEVDESFRLTDEDTVEAVVAYYREQIAASNEILGSLDLDSPCAWPEMAHRNLRWVALHLIEERLVTLGMLTSSARALTLAAGSESSPIAESLPHIAGDAD